MNEDALWYEMEGHVRRPKRLAQAVALGALLVVIALYHRAGWAIQGPALLCAVGMATAALTARRMHRNHRLIGRLLAWSFVALEATGFHLQAVAMGTAATPWILPLATTLSLAVSLFFIRPLDYGVAVATIWLILLPPQAHIAQTYDLVLLTVYVVAVIAVGFLINIGFTTTSAKLMLTRNAYRELSQTDPLTGLPNRRVFLDQLAACMDDPQASFIMLDVDHFKAINDQLGHLAGDQALQALAGQLKALQDQGICCGRLGGEEFGLLLPAMSASTVTAILQSLAWRCRQHTPPLSFSGGMVSLGDGLGLNEVVRQADIQLYLAKESGRGKVLHQGRDLLRSRADGAPCDPASPSTH